MGNCRYQLKKQRYSSHSQIFRLLQQVPASTRILEIGIASGYMGRYFSQRNFEITGIEKDKSLAEQAMPYYHKIFLLDLDREDVPFLRPFDFIILADILEHLYDPLKVLRKMHTLLKDNGRVIISIPNIANWIIRLRLAFGNFDYSDSGILDRDHIRFFTLKTAKGLIQEAKFKIVNCYSTSLPFQLLFKSAWIPDCVNEIYYLFVKLYPKLFAYQFVFTVAKI